MQEHLVAQEIIFITGNSGKAAEVSAVIPSVKPLALDLTEIQSLDHQEIVEAKLKEALNLGYKNVLIEDTALYFTALKGLPGPFIKWFLECLGLDGLYQMAQRTGSTKALARTIFGFASSGSEARFWEGETAGSIVAPSGGGFGWDAIFKPDGAAKTFGEMSAEEKAEFNMRKKALDKMVSDII